MNLSPLPIQKFFDSNGRPLVGGLLFTYAAATSSKQTTYVDQAGSQPNTNPIVLDYRGEANVWLDITKVYKFVLSPAGDTDPPTKPIWSVDNIAAPVSLVDLTQQIIGQILYPQTQAEIDASVTPTDYAVPSHDAGGTIIVRRYGGATGSGDNTAAMDSAEAVAAQLGGGVILLDRPGIWKMNWTLMTKGVTVRGAGGQGEYDLFCIRPFSIASAPITIGDGTGSTAGSVDVRYWSFENVHISGSDGTASGVTQSAHNSPQCVRIRGGAGFGQFFNTVLYNGLVTLSFEPSATNPVTQVFFGEGCTARNDITDSANARTIKGTRLADPGYLTAIGFNQCKLNGPGSRTAATLGYLAEFDGTITGITASFTDVYTDFPADFVSPTTGCHGILLKGGSGLVVKNLQLDPGATGVPVIECDATAAPTRYIVGNLRHGGQLMKFPASYITLPAEADTFSYKPLMQTPYAVLPLTFGTTADPYDAGSALPYFDEDGPNGPITMNRADLSVKTAGKGLRVAEGSNARQGLAVLVAGSKVVATTVVTANSRIFLTSNVDGGTPGFLRVSARSAGTSFTITSSNAADTSSVAWEIFEPA